MMMRLSLTLTTPVATMNNLQVIDQREILGKEFKIYGDFDNPLFLAKDVAEWIDNKNPTQMLAVVEDDEKLIYTMYIYQVKTVK